MLPHMIARCTAALFLAIAPAAMAQSLAGRWDGTVTVHGAEVPFRFELSGAGANVKGTFFNGDDRFSSTGGSYANGKLALQWAYYSSKLEATLSDGVLEGTYTQTGRGLHAASPFRATRHTASHEAAVAGPSIAGLWVIPNKSPKGEAAWRFIVRQSGSKVDAAILRVDGDTGELQGTYQDGKFVLSHFSGTRPSRMEITVEQDGTLAINQTGQFGRNQYTAVRAEEAKAKGLPEPDDPNQHTSVKDPTQPFAFRFPDLQGRLVSNTDPRFQGKVVLIEITGSWCPNCHDEAPFLEELYRKYRGQGLEIVALSFEESEQLQDPERLRAFVEKYGLEFTVLLAGDPETAKAALPQAVNWNAWPTTFFVGRDGLVKRVHAGFPSLGSGDLFRQAKAEFSAEVEHLLAQSQRTAR